MKYALVLTILVLVGCGSGDDSIKDDNTFQIKRDGFSFANYGSNRSVVNLTNESAAKLCGIPCLRGSGESCVVPLPLESFLEFANKQMGQGHCYGISVLSAAIFLGDISLASLDGLARTTYELPLSTPVQKALAYYSAAQYANPAAAAALKELTPNDVLNLLRAAGNEVYALAIFQPNFTKGHAVTALKVIDDSDVAARIAVYDSNYPGNVMRFINVNKSNNTWSYGAYAGVRGVNTLYPIPMSVPLLPQKCPVNGKADTLNAAMASDWQVLLVGEGDITNLPTTAQRFPVVSEEQNDDSPEPIHMLSAGQEYTLNIDGSQLSQLSPSSFYFHRPGHSIRIQDIFLDPGQVDTVKLGADGNSLTYISNDKEFVTIRVDASFQTVDYEISLRPSGHGGGSETEVLNEMDATTGLHSLRVRHHSAAQEEGSVIIGIIRRTSNGDSEFENSVGVAMAPTECLHINYGSWTANEQDLALVRDPGCDGHARQNVALPDDV